jgi:hypothetical protein
MRDARRGRNTVVSAWFHTAPQAVTNLSHRSSASVRDLGAHVTRAPGLVDRMARRRSPRVRVCSSSCRESRQAARSPRENRVLSRQRGSSWAAPDLRWGLSEQPWSPLIEPSPRLWAIVWNGSVRMCAARAERPPRAGTPVTRGPRDGATRWCCWRPPSRAGCSRMRARVYVQPRLGWRTSRIKRRWHRPMRWRQRSDAVTPRTRMPRRSPSRRHPLRTAPPTPVRFVPLAGVGVRRRVARRCSPAFGPPSSARATPSS